MPYELPDPRNTANLPTAEDAFPYNKLSRSGEKPSILPAGSATPFTDADFPRIYIPWNHLTAGFPEDIQNNIMASPTSFITAIPYGAGPKFYSENSKADLLLMDFLEGFDFPDKGSVTAFFPVESKEEKRGRNKEEGRNRKSAFDKLWPLIVTGISDDFTRFLLWHQCFATPLRIVWNSVPFNPKALTWVIAAFQGNIVHDDASLIAEVLACLKSAAWRDIPLQNLIKRITQAQGNFGNPVELTVRMTQSWRLLYVETKNLEDDKGPVFMLMGKPITDDLDFHRALTAHIQRLKVCVNYKQLLNLDKIISCDWCKNQNHPSHACPFPEIDSAWYGPTTEELRLRMMKAEPPKDSNWKQKEDNVKSGSRPKCGRNNNDGWNIVRHGKKQ